MPEIYIDAPSWNSIFWFVGLTTIGCGALYILYRAQNLILSLHATAIVRGMIHNEFNKMLMDARKNKILKELRYYEQPENEDTEQ